MRPNLFDPEPPRNPWVSDYETLTPARQDAPPPAPPQPQQPPRGFVPAPPASPWGFTPPAPPPPPPGYDPAPRERFEPTRYSFTGPAVPYTTAVPVKPRRRIRWTRWIVRGLALVVVLFVIAVAWLAITAPLSKSLQPPTPPAVTLLAADGTPIARRGANVDRPVDAAKLPAHVTRAFLAIEDRRFYRHWGVDPWGIMRAMMHNMMAGGLREGGSTITQQLAKNAFLDSDRTAGRKLQEVLIAFWLEAWLSKNDILSRYLSNVYFGDNCYGLRAASKHYFNREPEELTVAQGAMLAGLVKAPSRLAPTVNLKGARDREQLVLNAMVESGSLTKAEADAAGLATPRPRTQSEIPDGTYFADWVLPNARDVSGVSSRELAVRTTLDRKVQRAAERAARRAALGKMQVAIVAMRPDGRVVGMVGGKNYDLSPFNRTTQARRQPGSTFKLFVYLAAMRAGLTPDSIIKDAPVTIGKWSPKNADGTYRGDITLRDAFKVSSNVAAARLTQQVGVPAVVQAARDLGISTPIDENPGVALGTSTVSLLELTSAFAAVAADGYPVRPRGLADAPDPGWYDRLAGDRKPLGGTVRAEMLDLLSASANDGTGRQAALSIPTYGKTGTTQDSRDALFVGFANDLIVGVWVGNDDNAPNRGLSGGGIPARIWRDVMTQALGVQPKPKPVPPTPPAPADNNDPLIDLHGFGMNFRVDKNGSPSLGFDPENSGPPKDVKPAD